MNTELEKIIIQTADFEPTIVDYDGGSAWYRILGYLEDPDFAEEYPSRVAKLIEEFPARIPDYELADTIRASSINFENRAKKFQKAETERIITRDRKFNAVCKKCKQGAEKRMIQSASGDEATKAEYACQNVACGFKWST